jgi:exopolyphosphatase/guanosine-5'-triphosphate,3'-diphosphate pyrophosphatase
MITAGGPRIAAAIDVGSNSVLLLVVAVAGDGAARAVDEALVTTRLGTRLRSGGPLDHDAAARTSGAVVDLAQCARAHGATDVWAFATGAARRASDGPAFVSRLAGDAGIVTEVLSGEREARLAHAAAVHGLGLEDASLLVVDVGGATTELTLGRGEEIEASVSLPVGALTLTETCAGDVAQARARAVEVLAATELPARARRAGASLIASGGTPTSLAALALGLARYEPRRVHGAILTADAVAGRHGVAGDGPIEPTIELGRAAILPAGACILGCVMDAAGADRVRVSDHGVRHAYLRERLAERGIVATMRALWG